MHKVLIVDDDRDIRDLLANILEGNPVQVLQAASPAEGRSIISRHDLDAGIFDLNLTPAMRQEGLLLLDELNHRQPQARALLISGQESTSARSAVATGRAQAFLRKPLQNESLLKHLADLGLPINSRWTAKARPSRPRKRRPLPMSFKPRRLLMVMPRNSAPLEVELQLRKHNVEVVRADSLELAEYAVKTVSFDWVVTASPPDEAPTRELEFLHFVRRRRPNCRTIFWVGRRQRPLLPTRASARSQVLVSDQPLVPATLLACLGV